MLDLKRESHSNDLVGDIEKCDGPPIAYFLGVTSFRYEFYVTLVNYVLLLCIMLPKD